jgi:hypothetical protein
VLFNYPQCQEVWNESREIPKTSMTHYQHNNLVMEKSGLSNQCPQKLTEVQGKKWNFFLIQVNNKVDEKLGCTSSVMARQSYLQHNAAMAPSS